MKKIAIQGFRGCFHEQAARQFYAALEKDVPQTVECETFDLPGYFIDDNSQYTGKKDLPYLDVAGAYDEEKKSLSLFVINRNHSIGKSSFKI